MHIFGYDACERVCAEGPQNLSNRSSPMARGPNDRQRGAGEEDQFVFIGPLFLFPVLRRFPSRSSVPLSPSLPPLRPRPSAHGVSFTADPLRAKLVNSSVTIRRANPRSRRLCHRNGQLLTKSDHLFAPPSSSSLNTDLISPTAKPTRFVRPRKILYT